MWCIAQRSWRDPVEPLTSSIGTCERHSPISDCSSRISSGNVTALAQNQRPKAMSRKATRATLLGNWRGTAPTAASALPDGSGVE